MENLDLNENQKVTKFEYEEKRKRLQDSSVQFSNTSKGVRSIFSDFYDKILFYSAGAFSFSLALIGLVLKDNKEGLTTIGLFFPNIYWLYISLFSYLLTMFLVLISKKFDGNYLGYFASGNHSSINADFEKARINFLCLHEGQIVMAEGTETSEVETSKHNFEVSTKMAKKHAKRSNTYYALMRGFQTSAEISVFFASIFLFVFFGQLIQSVIWK